MKRGRFFFVVNCPYFAKYVLNGKKSTFLSKNSGKKLRISKNMRTFALVKLIKQYKTMKKKIFICVFWAFVALGLCTLVCVQWLSTGCGWQSIVMAAAFYCALCFGGYVLVDDILKERR